jgi:hypothetical protein
MNTSFTVSVLSPEGRAEISNEVYSERIQQAGIKGVRGLTGSESETVERSMQVDGGRQTDVGPGKIEGIKDFPGRRQ